ncbi:MAG: hypothetical protein GY748_25355 [Planctomycetaceae bacterium]|nr:hypothetical protein [Planctomycetaceae bacterium]MCP4477391.1 hypothetical protein [Planctomycetaceae bacterium]
MRISISVFWLSVMCVFLLVSAARGQPERQSSSGTSKDSEIPDGFERQALELGGEILKPIGWRYESREVGKTIVTKIWEPLANEEYAYETGFTIDIVTNTAEAGKRPSEYAVSYLDKLKKTGEVVKVYKPKETNGMIVSGILLDQKMTMADSEKKYRIRTVLSAHDDSELLFVITFGTLVTSWDKYEPTFSVMTKNLKVIDLSKKPKSDQ